jgi:Putative S-adenosyl-L-methionine-dependent methyltransferase
MCYITLHNILFTTIYASNITRYEKMEACLTPLPEVNDPDEVSGGEIKPFPARLNSVPPRISTNLIPGYTSELFQKDNNLWKKHVKAYKRVNKYLDSGRYRNIMDMNAGLGSFAAAIESPKLWVMNVVPTAAEMPTLGAIYERGLIGIYHDWYFTALFFINNSFKKCRDGIEHGSFFNVTL